MKLYNAKLYKAIKLYFLVSARTPGGGKMRSFSKFFCCTNAVETNLNISRKCFYYSTKRIIDLWAKILVEEKEKLAFFSTHLFVNT